MILLGIETSCDETAAAVVRDGRDPLSNVVLSQIPLHRAYGGVVPEIASRRHIECLPDVIRRALADAGVDWSGLDGLAVTYGPGLASSLLVGLQAAKALAVRLGLPLTGVNHIEGHLVSAFIGAGAPELAATCPFTALIVSGGHSTLLRVTAPGRYHLLGATVDDAAGEAFDKGAKLLGLPYPGGPSLERAAQGGDPQAIPFPRGHIRENPFAFSFSGLKTALLHHLKRHPLPPHDPGARAHVAASYQEAIVDALVARTLLAARDFRPVAVVGGVSLNRRLRERMTEEAGRHGFPLLLARPEYCGDNAAMIAAAAGLGLGVKGEGALSLDCAPRLSLTPR